MRPIISCCTSSNGKILIQIKVYARYGADEPLHIVTAVASTYQCQATDMYQDLA